MAYVNKNTIINSTAAVAIKMKRQILYLLLLTYAANMLKPVLPFATDAIAHTFFYYKHISTVHSVNGKNHVHHEFIREAKKDNTAGKADACKKMDNPDDQYFSYSDYKLIHYGFSNKQPICLKIIICKKHADCNFPPPKFI